MFDAWGVCCGAHIVSYRVNYVHTCIVEWRLIVEGSWSVKIIILNKQLLMKC